MNIIQMTILSLVFIFSTHAQSSEASLELKRGQYLPYISAVVHEGSEKPVPLAIFCLVDDQELIKSVKEQNPYYTYLSYVSASTEKINPDDVVSSINLTSPQTITLRTDAKSKMTLKVTCSD